MIVSFICYIFKEIVHHRTLYMPLGRKIFELVSKCFSSSLRILSKSDTQKLIEFNTTKTSKQITTSSYFKKRQHKSEWLFDIEQKKVSKIFKTPRFNLAFIDVGIVNLALAVYSIDYEWQCFEINFFEKIDLTMLDKNLTCNHSNEISDRVDRFAVFYDKILKNCDKIFIERQPILGIKSVEQLLFQKYREKAILVSPVAIQYYFQFSKRHGYDYDKRKLFVTEKATSLINENGSIEVKEKWEKFSGKKDDISDAVFMGFYIFKIKQEEKKQKILS